METRIKGLIAYLTFALILISLSAFAQQNINQVGQLSYQQSLSDIWGYVDSSGHEYALVTAETGISIVDISSDPANPAELFYRQGPQTTWRDVKVWNNHAYMVNEGGSGMLIIDLSNLPNSIQTKRFTANNQFSTAHNIFIDEKGFAYVMGYDQDGGALIFDLTQDPMNPVLVGNYDKRYVHDGYVRNDTFWSAEIEDGIFSVVDVSDKTNPTVMATQSTPSNFTHNLWLSDDGNTLFTTDERPGAYIASYDVSQLNNITELDRYQSSPDGNVTVHNTFVKNDFIITSYYRDGVVVNDATYPDNLIQTGHLDTSPLTGSGFDGCWGVYPYLPSGLVLATDVNEGLFVLDVNYQKAAYLEGNVTDSITGYPVQDAEVQITGSPGSEQTDLAGNYKTGIADPGVYDVTYNKPGYYPETVNVSLVRDSIQIKDVELAPKPNFAMNGQVENQANGQGIANAEVKTTNGAVTFTTTTQQNGQFTISNLFKSQFEIFAGKWGFFTKKKDKNIQTDINLVIPLKRGYYDDFFFDNNWQVQSTASDGIWERGEPVGTSISGQQVNPDNDVAHDFGDQCYITGNGGGDIRNDDIDSGFTRLTSPVMELASYYIDPYVSFYYWFINGGGQGPANDTMKVALYDGNDTIRVATFGQDSSASNWRHFNFRVKDYIGLTNSVKLMFTVSDQEPGHIVEAGIDQVQVVDSAETSARENELTENPQPVEIFPNPASSKVSIQFTSKTATSSRQVREIVVFNATGQKVYKKELSRNTEIQSLNISDWSTGVYFIKATAGQQTHFNKLVVTD